MKGINCNICENKCKSAVECVNEAEPFCYNCNHFYGDDECNNCVYYEPKNGCSEYND